ncbi:hypothetical protein AB0J72_19860 [Dactylosporangium sp. NPDC049742]|uniref:hypothetical protein n=1 Tax=Dactylosporangium sp. NPDC049742 TaxID=3154737 RepID=UPI003437D16C
MTTPTSVGTPADARAALGLPPDPPVYPATHDGVMEALTALGDTADAIAAVLLANDYTGRTASPACCPIARYLINTVPDLDANDVEIGTDDAGLWNAPHNYGIYVDLPGPVVAFITDFDGGAYPELAW